MHTFRFAAITPPQGGGTAWTTVARQVADQGFSTLLVPDGPGLHAPFPALAVAATAAPGLRVGTFVLAAPLRSPRATAWEAHTLTALTDGRFEFGIGTGRPDVRTAVESFDRTWGDGTDRLALVGATLDRLRELDGDRPTPVLMAASGPRALAVAAQRADVVALATPPLTPRSDVARTVAGLRSRGRDPRVAMNLFVVGDDRPPWAQRAIGTDPATLGPDSLAVLRGTPVEMADELRRRRDEIGVSVLVADARYGVALAPVIERLAGR